jgi:hypothetical protein
MKPPVGMNFQKSDRTRKTTKVLIAITLTLIMAIVQLKSLPNETSPKILGGFFDPSDFCGPVCKTAPFQWLRSWQRFLAVKQAGLQIDAW